MAVKELITLRRDRPLLKSFTTPAFNGSAFPAGAAAQLVKALAAAARVSGSQSGTVPRTTALLLGLISLELHALGNGHGGNWEPSRHCSQEADLEILIKTNKKQYFSEARVGGTLKRSPR